MKWLLFVAAIAALSSPAFGADAAKKKHLKFHDESKQEGWTFHFSEEKPRAKGLKKKKVVGATYVEIREDGSIPNTLDLRPSLTQIEDQGQCGSCWAFSLTASHRDGHAVNQRDPGRLSQQYLVDCAANQYGCGGGYFDAADYLKRPGLGAQGSPLLSAYPYTATDGRCKSTVQAAAWIKSWHFLGNQSDGPSVRDIESYMAAAKKPVAITVAAGAGPWASYDSGVYNACRTGTTDHMINIVGWDNEGASFDAKGNLPPGKGIWILRNSWGTGWGENGYMRTKMTDSAGRRCNAVGEEAVYYVFEDEPAPTPTPSPTPTPTPSPTPPGPHEDVPWWGWLLIALGGGGLVLIIIRLAKRDAARMSGV
jgi:C1A family cysteine protease